MWSEHFFSNAFVDGKLANELYGLQTLAVQPGGGYIAEFTPYQAGRYPFVTHAFGDADHGAMGVFEAK